MVYVAENSSPLTTLACSTVLSPFGCVQIVGASSPKADCVEVGTFVRHVMRALEEVSAATCASLIARGSSGGGGVSEYVRELSGRRTAPLSAGLVCFTRVAVGRGDGMLGRRGVL